MLRKRTTLEIQTWPTTKRGTLSGLKVQKFKVDIRGTVLNLMERKLQKDW